MTSPDEPQTIEIAVTPEGKVSINYRQFKMEPDGWGHLTFDVDQAMQFLHVFSEATKQAFLRARMNQMRNN